MKYKAVIFDMDGTILDTLEDLTDSVNHMMREYHFPERTIQEVRSFVGNGIHLLIERAVPAGTNQKIIEKIFCEFGPYYKENCSIKTKPYNGIEELITVLRKAGCKTAVVSNKPDAAVQELCNQYFPDMFDFAAGERSDIRKKPAPDSVDASLKSIGIDREDAVYVGDSEVDIQTAQNAGMDSIIVTWGFRDEDWLRKNGAKVIVQSPEEVRKIVLGD